VPGSSDCKTEVAFDKEILLSRVTSFQLVGELNSYPPSLKCF
jgi:hypothetical protein